MPIKLIHHLSSPFAWLQSDPSRCHFKFQLECSNIRRNWNRSCRNEKKKICSTLCRLSKYLLEWISSWMMLLASVMNKDRAFMCCDRSVLLYLISQFYNYYNCFFNEWKHNIQVKFSNRASRLCLSQSY